ncbi:MAG: helix-turn-helix domain containing protein [Candidatus Gribaldobacteria bacterium]|nr:helix-turn-helix domain containing protein [Candidatus Gribaldobacteria bacterium]
MSYVGKLKLKQEAIRLRRNGLSVKEIQKRLQVSMSSVSLWVRDVKLTQKQLRKLYLNKRTGALRGCIVAAMNRTEQRKKLTCRLIDGGKKEVGCISKRDKFMAGIAMYFSEGDKASESVAFSNSDPRAIEFMADWFREFCKVPEDKFRCYLYIHDNLDEVEAKKFWSKILRLPITQFRKSYIVKNNPKRLRKTKNIYGVLRISISDVNLHRRIMGWIEGIFNPL